MKVEQHRLNLSSIEGTYSGIQNMRHATIQEFLKRAIRRVTRVTPHIDPLNAFSGGSTSNNGQHR
jgi:hypothetical protein